MEAVLADSAVDWVALRPPRLSEKAAKGAYRTGRTLVKGGGSITIEDLASALIDCAEQPEPRGAVYVSN
jgi:hypothetical protein